MIEQDWLHIENAVPYVVITAIFAAAFWGARK